MMEPSQAATAGLAVQRLRELDRLIDKLQEGRAVAHIRANSGAGDTVSVQAPPDVALLACIRGRQAMVRELRRMGVKAAHRKPGEHAPVSAPQPYGGSNAERYRLFGF